MIFSPIVSSISERTGVLGPRSERFFELVCEMKILKIEMHTFETTVSLNKTVRIFFNAVQHSDWKSRKAVI